MKINTRQLKDSIKDTLMETLDIVFIETDDPYTLEAVMHVSKYHTQTMGVLHGGATIALAESIAGVGSNIVCEQDEMCFGMQVSASHISSAPVGDTVRAIARIEHQGRTTHIWDVQIMSEQSLKLVSTVRVTNAVVKRRNRKEKFNAEVTK